MVGWLARGLLIAAGFVTSWFMTRDSPQFGVMQVAVATLLLALIVAVLAFWPARWTQALNRLRKPH
jgi:small-conductance mechanosensitive channel